MTRQSLVIVFMVTVGFFVPVLEAEARPGTPCNSCQTCSDALALPSARVFLADDLVHEGEGPCIIVKGLNAKLDGLEREIRPLKREKSVGISIQAPNAVISNVHIAGAEKAVEIFESKFATLYHLWLEDNTVGVEVGPSRSTRIARSVFINNTHAIDIGAEGDGACSAEDQKVRDTYGTVVTGNHVENNKTSVTACSDVPYLMNNTIVNNQQGVVVRHPKMITGNEPGNGPYDVCACAPTLPKASAGTSLFFSSGCNGCKVHEAWLPELEAKGADILLRASGPGTEGESKVYDAHIDRCAPQVTDALGIPGCVPNYACIANDATFKVRAGEKRLNYETQISSAEGLEAYATECRTDAEKRIQEGDDCIRYLAVDNVFCKNGKLDFDGEETLSKWPGLNNACSNSRAFVDEGQTGCSRPCTEWAPVPAKPEARMAKGIVPPPPVLRENGKPMPPVDTKMDMASLLKDKDTGEKGTEEKTEEAVATEGKEPEKKEDDGIPFWFWAAVASALLYGYFKKSKSEKS